MGNQEPLWCPTGQGIGTPRKCLNKRIKGKDFFFGTFGRCGGIAIMLRGAALSLKTRAPVFNFFMGTFSVAESSGEPELKRNPPLPNVTPHHGGDSASECR